MISTKCAICETDGNFEVLYQARLPDISAGTAAFDPRRERDYFHYQMVKCRQCGLVRANPIFEPEQVTKLYVESKFNYSDQDDFKPLNQTYSYYLNYLIKKFKPKQDNFLDIGCGNGFFLETAQNFGFKEVVGVEPSSHALAQAKPQILPNIKEGVFTADLFAGKQFDVITALQTFEHILSPNQFLADIKQVLRPGGLVLIISHNVSSVASRFFKERCPIIDIGHVYLYDKETIRRIFEKHNFKVLKVFSVRNIIAVNYLIKLLPIKQQFKDWGKTAVRGLNVSQARLPLYMGNLGIIAQQ